MATSRRVLITGIGLVTPLGLGRERSWQGLVEGHRAARWCPAEPAHDFLAPWPGWETPLPGATSPLRETPREPVEPVVAQALAAAAEAVADAGLNFAREDRHRAGCVIGTSKGGLESFRAFWQLCRAGRQTHDAAARWQQFAPDASARAVASRYDLKAFALCPVAACATGLVSVARAADLVAQGACDVALAGSSDASLTPLVMASFRRLGVLARDFEDPAAACRPFDARRNGFLVGEGAALLVLEHFDHALARGARAYGEWLAGRVAADPTHVARLEVEPISLARLVTDALREANVAPDEIDYVSLHGTATRANDLAETRALKQALAGQARRVAGSSLKGSIGHLLGAAGSVELAATLLAMRDAVVPPTANLEAPDELCDLDYTPGRPRPKRIETALKLSLGFGGHLGCAVLRGPGADYSRRITADERSVTLLRYDGGR